MHISFFSAKITFLSTQDMIFEVFSHEIQFSIKMVLVHPKTFLEATFSGPKMAAA